MENLESFGIIAGAVLTAKLLGDYIEGTYINWRARKARAEQLSRIQEMVAQQMQAGIPVVTVDGDGESA